MKHNYLCTKHVTLSVTDIYSKFWLNLKFLPNIQSSRDAGADRTMFIQLMLKCSSPLGISIGKHAGLSLGRLKPQQVILAPLCPTIYVTIHEYKMLIRIGFVTILFVSQILKWFSISLMLRFIGTWLIIRKMIYLRWFHK